MLGRLGGKLGEAVGFFWGRGMKQGDGEMEGGRIAVLVNNGGICVGAVECGERGDGGLGDDGGVGCISDISSPSFPFSYSSGFECSASRGVSSPDSRGEEN